VTGRSHLVAQSPQRWWLGRNEPPERPRHVQAGPVEFDLSGIDVRRIVLDGHEVISRIYVGVRDIDWETLPPVVEGLDVRTMDDGTVAVSFEARHAGSEIDLIWRGSITASPEGRIAYAMDATAGSTFRYNRIGLCILHPATAAGRPYRAWTPGGPVHGVLPALIAPQLIVDGVEVALVPACSRLEIDFEDSTVTTVFEGDLFEMEDQRNWTDGSFKTYCTPIAVGYPHQALAGDILRQRLEVSVSRPPPGAPRPASPMDRDEPFVIRVGEPAPRAWPQLGLDLGVASDGPAHDLPADVRRMLRPAGLDHLRLDLHLSDSEWPRRLDGALADASSIDARLEVALFVADDMPTEIERVAIRLARPEVARVIVLYEPTAGTATTPDLPLRTVVDAFAASGASAPPILTGTNGDFAEINRDRPVAGPWTGAAYAMNPQVHAVDELSLAESLPMQAQTVATARSFVGARSVVISPVTLRGRFNPAAAAPSAAPVEPPVDPRQASLFAAGWLLGSFASLVGGGADAVTYFETHGPRGVLDASGAPFPTWFVLADLADRLDWNPVRLEPGTGPAVTGIAMVRARATRILMANLTQEGRRVRIAPLLGSTVRLRSLDAGSAPGAVTSPAAFRATGRRQDIMDGRLTFEIEPFAYVRIDTLHEGS
jgi:D-apionolactonase